MKNVNEVARDLSQLIQGRVIDAGDTEYQRIVRIDNGRISHEPGLIVVPSSVDDVSAVVKHLAKRRGDGEKIPMTTRCGGHGASGYCLNTGGNVIDRSTFSLRTHDLFRVGGPIKEDACSIRAEVPRVLIGLQRPVKFLRCRPRAGRTAGRE